MHSPRVLVVHPPVSIARDYIDYPYFSDLAAVQLAAVLRAAGTTVSLTDAYALPGSGLAFRPDGRAHLGAPVSELLAHVAATAFSPAEVTAIVVVYTPFHRPPARCDVLGDVLAGLRAWAPGVPLWLADCYQSGQHYIDVDGSLVMAAYPEADAWVKYEAEVTVPALLADLSRGKRPRGMYLGTEAPELDALPLPAWDLVDLPAHDAFCTRVVARLGRSAWAFPIDGRTLPAVSSRGCPFTCAHCSSNPGRAEGSPKTQRRYTPARLRTDLTALTQTHGATRIALLDELANVNERHWDTLLDTFTSLGVRFDLPNGLRADYLTQAHLTRMHGRVSTVSISAESGSQRVVSEVVGKRLDLTAIVRAAHAAHAAHVPLMVHYILGMPGETPAEVNTTLDFALDLHARYGAIPAVQFATPLPGTSLARGRLLPVVSDWGPHFQTAPSQPDALVSPTDLLTARRGLDTRLRAAAQPPALVLALTAGCNNRCPFCVVSSHPRTVPDVPDPRKELLKHRAQGFRTVHFDGGEPTLHPELIALIGYAKSIGYETVTVTTNGRRCFYPAYAHALVRSGVSVLRVSLHGPEAASHGALVGDLGDLGAFAQTVAGIRHAVRDAPGGVKVRVCTRVTAETVEAVAALAASLGVHGLELQVPVATEENTRAVQSVCTRWKKHLDVQVTGLPACALGEELEALAPDPAYVREAWITPDGAKDLLAYRRPERVYRAVCAGCPHKTACGGFYGGDAGA